MTEETTIEKPVPRWVGIMAAVVVFGSLLGAGGYWFWSWKTQPPRNELVEVMAIPQARAANFAPAAPVTGIKRTEMPNQQIVYNVQAPDCVLTASKGPTDREWTLAMRYSRADFLTADQTAALSARFRLTADPLFAKALKVTDDQVAQLKEIPTGTPMVVSNDNLAKIKDLFIKATSQVSPQNEQALIAGMQQAMTASLDATKASVTDRVKKIQAILKPEQISPFKQ